MTAPTAGPPFTLWKSVPAMNQRLAPAPMLGKSQKRLTPVLQKAVAP
jgi:hypothetical protein